MTSAASWRITLYDTQSTYGDNFAIFSLIEFRETAGTPETASGGAAFASNTAFGDYNAPFAAGGGNWGNNGFPCNIGYNFPAAITVREVALRNRDSYSSQAPSHISIDYYDGTDWHTAVDIPGIDWAGTYQTKTFAVPAEAAPTTGVTVPQAATLIAARLAAHNITAPQLFALAPFNIPTANMRATFVNAVAILRYPSQMQVTQAMELVVCKGRKADPTVRAFTFTLDGHDFYVLRLGEDQTLVYDVSTGQWPEWTSPNEEFWRVNASHNWVGAEKLAYKLGSNILVGDDTYGLLYFLDAEQPYDDHPDYTDPEQQMPFERIVMGQYLVSGRDYQPCYVVFLDTDNYGLDAVDFTPSVKLETSDDQGMSFDDWGTITAEPNTDDVDYRWYSLGQMGSPGRLFRVTDNGLITRIDAMQMNDESATDGGQ